LDSNSFGEEDYESIKNKRTNFCCNSVFNLAELAGKRLIELSGRKLFEVGDGS